MKGDFTRNTFYQFRHFSRVLMQQGRVQLDADWNEQAAILLHYLHALAADIIGPFGGPASDLGFTLDIDPNNPEDFTIGQGHYYVDGLLCENDVDDVTFFAQSDYPSSDEALAAGTYLAYLDVWERHITMLEEMAIREVALGGPDTATRAKVVWQLKTSAKTPDGKQIPADIKPEDITKLWPDWVKAWNALTACQMRVRLKPEQASDDPCTLSPDSRYRGRENQLYRVEIHKGGSKAKDRPTFKWSRDNGSVAASWLGNTEDGGMIVSCARGFSSEQWIEITTYTDDLFEQTGQLVWIVRVEGDVLYPETPQAWDKDTPRKVRRWDQVETEVIKLSNGSVPIKEGKTDADWIDLEDGIQVQFLPGGSYRTGDYWLIPARRVGTIEWPGDPKNPDAAAPHGIIHHYAPIWIVSVAADGKVTLDPKKDLRRIFKAIPAS
jgi:Family of unknown function (DUF6519)